MNNRINILLGDNPLFGIDHLSQDRARKRMEVLSGFHKMTEIIEFAVQENIHDFVVSTHPQLRDFIDYLDKQTDLLDKLNFYPILPYAQGYVSAVTEKGLVRVVNDIISHTSMQQKMKIIMKGSIGYLQKDFDKLLQTFIDIELVSLNKTRKQCIFLHDVVTDLAISLNMKNIIELFIDHVKKEYGVKPGLVTKNFPRLISQLKNWNVEFPTVMTSFNPVGNQMNPSREACEKCLIENDVNVIAMNTLAGGLLKPRDIVNYVDKLNLGSVVIGMSTTDHIRETVSIFNK